MAFNLTMRIGSGGEIGPIRTSDQRPRANLYDLHAGYPPVRGISAQNSDENRPLARFLHVSGFLKVF